MTGLHGSRSPSLSFELGESNGVNARIDLSYDLFVMTYFLLDFLTGMFISYSTSHSPYEIIIPEKMISKTQVQKYHYTMKNTLIHFFLKNDLIFSQNMCFWSPAPRYACMESGRWPLCLALLERMRREEVQLPAPVPGFFPKAEPTGAQKNHRWIGIFHVSMKYIYIYETYII